MTQSEEKFSIVVMEMSRPIEVLPLMTEAEAEAQFVKKCRMTNHLQQVQIISETEAEMFRRQMADHAQTSIG